MAAAALAAGLVTSNAQVYSQNVVGYVSLPLTNGVLTLIAPALDLDGTGKNNTISTVFSTNGVTPGDVVYVFTGSGYDTISYALAGRGYATNGWYLGSTLTNNYPINPGEAVFYAPQANETNVQVGNVLLGTNVVNAYFPIAANQVNLVSSVIPLSGGVTTVLGYNPTPGDVIFQYTGAGYNTYSYSALAGVMRLLDGIWDQLFLNRRFRLVADFGFSQEKQQIGCRVSPLRDLISNQN